MRRGDFAEAWRQTDRTELPRRVRQAQPGFMREPRHLRWDGSGFAGRSVRVWCEHGLGDTLQFLRFVPALAAQARELHLMVQPPLVALLQGAPGLGRVHDGWRDAPPPPHDVEIEVMELAYALRTTLETLPPPYPHLAAQARGDFSGLPDGTSLRVGLLWAASDWDRSRSVPLPTLAPLVATPGVRFFGLQQGAALNEPCAVPPAIEPLSRHTRQIPAAAAAMLALDLIITVDGMPAHLAGTLGRPTWVLLKHEADWRWMAGRSDSPWYPSMRLFRQPAPGDWTAPIKEMARALRQFRSPA